MQALDERRLLLEVNEHGLVTNNLAPSVLTQGAVFVFDPEMMVWRHVHEFLDLLNGLGERCTLLSGGGPGG